jgi:hypothetical protein
VPAQVGIQVGPGGQAVPEEDGHRASQQVGELRRCLPGQKSVSCAQIHSMVDCFRVATPSWLAVPSQPHSKCTVAAPLSVLMLSRMEIRGLYI